MTWVIFRKQGNWLSLQLLGEEAVITIRFLGAPLHGKRRNGRPGNAHKVSKRELHKVKVHQ